MCEKVRCEGWFQRCDFPPCLFPAPTTDCFTYVVVLSFVRTYLAICLDR